MQATRKVGHSILFIDDDADQRGVLGIVLEQGGFSVTSMGCAQEALAELQQQHFDVVVCDLKMPVMNGEEFLERFRSKFGRKTPVVIVSADYEAIDEFLSEFGNTRFCRKENCATTLLRHVENALAVG